MEIALEELYEFDRTGYVHLPGALDRCTVDTLSSAVDRLAEHAEDHAHSEPRIVAPWGDEYHCNLERGYHVRESHESGGRDLLIEDFLNFDPAFDVLVNDPLTMSVVQAVIKERPTINNTELRLRFPGHYTPSHMGGPNLPMKYRYSVDHRGIDCMMIRFIYFLHDVSTEEGAFCVVPGTHKTKLPSPYQDLLPQDEPGMIPVPARAGDAIMFTENLRHGGLPNRSSQVRKTLHVGYGPFWMKSQNVATMDSNVFLLPQTATRYDPDQRRLFQDRPDPTPQQPNTMHPRTVQTKPMHTNPMQPA